MTAWTESWFLVLYSLCKAAFQSDMQHFPDVQCVLSTVSAFCRIFPVVLILVIFSLSFDHSNVAPY